jgi:Na+:H+ antiporter, NhaA family
MIRITQLFKDFTNSERSAGFVLIFTTILSLLLANLFIGGPYVNFFHNKVGIDNSVLHLNMSIGHWINDGLMTIFFLLVGLEIEREVYIGEISTFKNASLPVTAAIGGMLVPFIIHFMFNYGTVAQRGGGIPVATDIAFALGVLSLSKKVPYGLKVFLTAFAIIDDLGAIIIISIFYTSNLNFIYLFAAFGLLAVMIVLNRLKVYKVWVYLVLGTIMWYCMMQSGVHATISGVLLAFAIPFGNGDKDSPSYNLQRALHKPVAFIILPVFALGNTGIIINDTWVHDLQSSNSLGIISGLVLGKPLGILIASYIVVKLKWSSFPTGVQWKHLFGAAVLGGIGFTMSIFITLIAFNDDALINQSKISILVASTLASFLGLFVLSFKDRKRPGLSHRTSLF